MTTIAVAFAIPGADESTNKLAKIVSFLSLGTLALLIINTIVQATAEVFRDVLKGDFSSLGLSPEEEAALEGVSLAPFLIGGILINILIFACIMCCGYSGAQNRNPGTLRLFSVCNGICFAFQICNVLTLVGAIGAVGASGINSEVAQADQGRFISGVIFNVILTILFALNCGLGFKLAQKTTVLVAQGVPVDTPVMQTVQAEPVKGTGILGDQKV